MTKKRTVAQIRHYGQKSLEVVSAPVPSINDSDVLVKVVAASINPIDLKTRDGKLKLLLPYQMPLILGSDFAGIIEKVVPGVTGFHAGDQVYGRVQKDRIGTFATEIAVDQADIALKPANLTFEEAAAVPLVGLTSYQALFEVMQLKAGDKVLIQAGSGGIGSLAVQLAKQAGAYVATTTSALNADFCRELGADQVIDYHNENFATILKDYDAVFDTQGGRILEQAFQIVKPGGKVVSLSGMPDRKFARSYGLPWWKQQLFGIASRRLTKLAKQTGTSYHFLFMRPDGAQLKKLTAWFEAGKLRPVIDRVLPFSQIQEAVRVAAAGHARGKIVIRMVETAGSS